MAGELLEEREDGVVLNVKVRPGADRFRLEGVNSWRNNLRVSVSSGARKGKANQELLEELGSILGRKVRILSGSKSREKKLLVEGASRSGVSKMLDL